jgi:hypothetical protein
MLSDETPIFVCWNTLLYKLTLIRRHNIPIRNSVLQTFAYSLSKSNKDLAVYIPIEMIAFGDSIYFDEGSLSTLSEKVRRIGRNQEERRQTQPNSLSIYTNMRTKRYIFTIMCVLTSYHSVPKYFLVSTLPRHEIRLMDPITMNFLPIRSPGFGISWCVICFEVLLNAEHVFIKIRTLPPIKI